MKRLHAKSKSVCQASWFAELSSSLGSILWKWKNLLRHRRKSVHSSGSPLTANLVWDELTLKRTCQKFMFFIKAWTSLLSVIHFIQKFHSPVIMKICSRCSPENAWLKPAFWKQEAESGVPVLGMNISEVCTRFCATATARILPSSGPENLLTDSARLNR